jgi:hypothetical protein
MGCNCRKRTQSNNQVQASDSSPVVYLVCRQCKTCRAVRFNIATQLARQACQKCGVINFHIFKNTPKIDDLKGL